jgi:hypothetical protein
MRKFLLLMFICVVLTGLYIKFKAKKEYLAIQTITLTDSTAFTLKRGDIIARPNRGDLPGACNILNGRRYGHAAIVIKGASGKNVEEALSGSVVIEALFFDQGTHKFQFNKKDQIREAPAKTSFGSKFKGIRYILRRDLPEKQIEEMIRFAENQLDEGYNILSLKKKYNNGRTTNASLAGIRSGWHCATLIWEAFYLSSGLDLDANGGLLVYPSDIIASKMFDSPGQRFCF